MSKNLFGKDGVKYTPAFDSVAIAFSGNHARLLGKIARYCEMKDGKCMKSQDDLAFELGLSIKTVERAIKDLKGEGLIYDLTPKSKQIHELLICYEDLIEFDRKFYEAFKIFLQLEQIIIADASEDLIRQFVVSRKNDTSKILRRYVNLSYAKGRWYVKMTHIILINKELNTITLQEFINSSKRSNKQQKREETPAPKNNGYASRKDIAKKLGNLFEE